MRIFLPVARGNLRNGPWQDEGDCRGLPWTQGYARSRDGPRMCV